MSKFLTRLCVVEVSSNDWKLYEPLSYESDLLKAVITVPAEFVTDFASFRVLDMSLSIGEKSSVLHDFCYRTGYLPRKMADKLFLEALKVEGVGWWDRTKMYCVVRMFGRSSYKGKV